MRRRVQFENGGDGVIQEGAVVRDDQRCPVEAVQPVFQPFEHGDVEVVGGFVEQQQVRLFQQDARQHQAGLLAAGEVGDGGVEVEVAQAEGAEGR